MSDRLEVRVRLFAIARQLAGANELTVVLPPPGTVAQLRAALAESSPALSPVLPHSLFSINAEYAGNERVIPPGAEVACIPPVSGG